jgi:hypothetical protein
MRCKALKSKAHSLGWCYWRYNTPHRPFAQPPSFYHFTTLTLSFFSLSISAPHSLCTTTTYFLLLSQHLGWHLTSYLWRIDTRLSSVHFAGNCRYLVSKLLGSTTGIVRVWRHPVYTLLLFQFFLARLAGAIPYYTRPSFLYVLHLVGGYPQFEHLATTSYHHQYYLHISLLVKREGVIEGGNLVFLG